MEVPCCTGLMGIVEKARQISGENVRIKKSIIALDGNVVEVFSV